MSAESVSDRAERVRDVEGLGRAAPLCDLRVDCRYALGNTRRHRSNGRWSDGVSVAPLKNQDTAPIQP